MSLSIDKIKKDFSDHGGEFIDDIFIEICERFNMKVQNSMVYVNSITKD